MAASMWKQAKLLTLVVRHCRLSPCLCGYEPLAIRHMHKGGGERLKAPPKAKVNLAWHEKLKALKAEKRAGEVKEKTIRDTAAFQARVPTDDVWLQSEYPTKRFTFSEALAMHREFCNPEMFNNTDGFVKFEAVLDMRTKKKTKFMKSISKMLVLPHYFDDGCEKRIMAICKTQEEKEMALKMGAVHAGGIEIIKAIEKGEIKNYEYDYLVCTSEMVADLAKVRKLLKDVFPNQKYGTVSPDLKAMLDHFMLGKKYESKKDDDDETTGTIEVLLGKLDMTDEQLRENMDCYLVAFNQHKKIEGNFILDGAISVLPESGETFYLNPEECLTEDERQLEAEIQDEDIESDNEQEAVVASKS